MDVESLLPENLRNLEPAVTNRTAQPHRTLKRHRYAVPAVQTACSKTDQGMHLGFILTYSGRKTLALNLAVKSHVLAGHGGAHL